jgi:pilus assembly protein CpaB
MRTGTMVSLGASALLGVGALIVARVWLPQPTHAPQAKPGEVAANTVPVVVATTNIAYGTKLDAAHLMIERLPAEAAPQGAYSSPQQLLQQSGGVPIALTPIAAREPVLPGKLSGGNARPTVSAAIGEGMRAYTIGVTDVGGVGGHAMPGDRVDVVLTRELPHLSTGSADGCDCKRVIANVVLQDIRVLGMDLNADPASTQAAVAHTATLEVTVKDAEKLAVAAQSGTLSLALRRTGNAEVAPVGVIEVKDLGSRPTTPDFHVAPGGRILTVSQRRAPHGPPARMFVPTRSVIVVHGDLSTPVEVPAERFGAGA